MAKFLQWNIRSVNSNYEDLKLLVHNHHPKVVALQDTVKDFTFSGYHVYHKKLINDSSPGGVALMIENSLVSSEIDLLTDLEASAVRVSVSKKTFTFCSLYLYPSICYSKIVIENLFDQLPRPAVIMGDFNAHNPLWGSSTSNRRGKDLEDIFTLRNMIVLNDGSHTYLHRTNNTASYLDLTVVDPSVMLDFQWSVLEDTHGSDHYPILLDSDLLDDEDTTKRFNLKKADWDSYSDICRGRIKEESIFKPDSCPVESITRVLFDIADDCIPRSEAKGRRTKVPWYNDQCRAAKRRRKCALRRFRRAPTLANLLAFRNARARCKSIMKNAKRTSWREFCSSLNSKARASTVWRALRRIKGKKGGPSLQHLHDDNGTPLTDKKAIANLLASTLEKNSSSGNVNSQFRKIKDNAERKPIDFSSDCSEKYNLPFTLMELKEALRKSGETAAGLDNIHYQFLKHLPESSLNILLKVYNQVWESGIFPPSWREALIIPIPKPGKDTKNPNNYRPIALTSCLCKTMERMVNARLNYCLENSDMLAKEQCGFRKGRSTTDHLVRFETFIREAFAQEKHVVAVFFDLEKAYDTTWKRGILNNLHEMGFRGRLANFIEGFLENRTFKVKAGSTYSDSHVQDLGVPQGSILSPALFSIQINKIVKAAKLSDECSLFVDDFAVCVSAKRLSLAVRQLQHCVDDVQKWVTNNGFKFSESKTVSIHFWKGNNIEDVRIDIDSKDGRVPIKSVNETRFLGLIFDRKLTFLSHIRDLKTRCLKALDVLKVVGHTDWGADRKVLLQLYQALVRSKLDYGCIVYGSSAKSNLEMLDPIHNAGLRLALGAFRTSPVQSLYTEARETSLNLRRLKLGLNYALKLKSMPDNPAFDCVFNPKEKLYFEAHPEKAKPFSLRIEPHLIAAELPMERIEITDLPPTPPWELKVPEICFTLTELNKSNTNELIYQSAFHEVAGKYPDFKQIFTDGSKTADAVGAASVSGKDFKKVFKDRLPSYSSVYSAELKALLLALKMVYQSKDKQFIIFSDSLSALSAIKERKLDHPFLQDFFEGYNMILEEGKHIVLAWVPSHVGIRGNCAADTAAKEALELDYEDLAIRYSDLKRNTKQYVNELSQHEWTSEGIPRRKVNKLWVIQPDRSDPLPMIAANRREESVLTRLHIGHSHLTHSFLLKEEEEIPVCIGCDENLTVEHILLHCWDFYDIRRKHYSAENLKVLFRDVPPDKIFDFLKEINIFNKI